MKLRYLSTASVMAGFVIGSFSSFGCGGGGGSSSGGGGGGNGTGSRVTVSVSGARSQNVPVEIDPARSKINTPFSQDLAPGGPITLYASEGVADRQFQHWLLNGQVLSTQPTLQTTTPAGDFSLTAVYTPRACGPNGFTPNFAGELDPQDGQPNKLYWWHDFPIRVYFDETQSLVDRSVIEQIRAGFDTWHEATGVLGAYELTTDAASADITVRFTHQPEGNGVAFTDLVFFTGDNTLDKATITFIVPRISADAFTRVGAHEFGHALGLEGHSNVPADVMSIPSGLLPLTARDINTLASGYCAYYNRGRHAAPRPAAITEHRATGTAHISCPGSGITGD